MNAQEIKQEYNNATDVLSKKKLDKELKAVLMYVRHLHDRIEKSYDNGFKDGQKKNPQIQEYIGAKKNN